MVIIKDKIQISEEAKKELEDLKKELGLDKITDKIIAREPRWSFLLYEIEASIPEENKRLKQYCKIIREDIYNRKLL